MNPELSPLDGELHCDEASLAAAANDFGGIIKRRPRAVLRPRSMEEVCAAVRFARTHRLTLAPRGCGHSTYGQAQTEGGLLVDMSALSAFRELGSDYAVVEGGCTWATVVERAAAANKAPPALTDYLHLSVGGTLSLGGVGGASFRCGTQTDHVRELTVVTGSGELVVCSSEHHRELFDSVRAGLGQCGVIVQARLALVEVPPRVRIYELYYPALSPFLHDQQRLAAERRFDYQDGTILATAAGRYVYKLTLATQYHPGREPDSQAQLAGLAHFSDRVGIKDCTHREFAHRVDGYVSYQQSLGLWQSPHPWLDVFVPASRVESFVRRILPELGGASDGMILTYLLKRSLCRTPLLALPDEEWIYLVDLLRNTSPPTPERVAEQLATNARLLHECVALGGGLYPISAVPAPAADPRRTYRHWERLAAAKQRFDPDRVLTPGQGLFSD